MGYLGDKGYWIRSTEMPTPVGIIDAWGIKSSEFTTMAIEAKVSRGDYRSRSQRYKEFSANHIANYCYLICPEVMIKEHDSPNWGILWYYEKSDRLRLVKPATRFEMSDRDKLAVMLHCFYSGVNNPDKRLVIDSDLTEDQLSIGPLFETPCALSEAAD